MAVHVSGASLMARLLRSTVGALNTSSDTRLETSNLGERPRGPGRPRPRGGPGAGCRQALSAAALSPACLPQPQRMAGPQYASSCLPLALLGLLCLGQAYTFRLRRAIAAFYFPKVSGRRGPGRGAGAGREPPAARHGLCRRSGRRAACSTSTTSCCGSGRASSAGSASASPARRGGRRER